MTLRILLRPFPGDIRENTGIGRVVHAQYKLLPDHDIVFVRDFDQADLFVGHTQQFNFPRLDVLHLHGLYFTGDRGIGDYTHYHHKTNKVIIEGLRRAQAVSVPSDWTAEMLRRDLRLQPVILGHGIDLDQWKEGENAGYILYNKNREADVCTAKYAAKLAAAGEKVVSTFAPKGEEPPPNLIITGPMSHEMMKEVIQSADIYLATVQETFGIGILEAMASGLPILGFRHGGIIDLVRHKKEGWLAEPDDFDGLREGLVWLRKNRKKVSEAAKKRAQQFSWKNVMGQYAQLYHTVSAFTRATNDGVSVVITSYNYGHYVKEAVESVLLQTAPAAEIIIIDDGSKDDTEEILKEYKTNPKVKYIRQENLGVAAARNHGTSLASQQFIVCLDADDRLGPTYLERCLNVIKTDRSLGIVYTGLIGFNDAGQSTPVQTREFDWKIQARGGVPPATCVPTGAMFRKSMWERAGGFKQRYAPGEDAEFWTRGLSLGFTARLAAPEGLFYYRGHPGSASRTLQYIDISDDKPWIHDHFYPLAAPTSHPVLVRSYSKPLITVVLTIVNSPDVKEVQQRIDWVVGQEFRDWTLLLSPESEVSQDLLEEFKTLYPFLRLAEKDWLKKITTPYFVLFSSGEKWNPITLREGVRRAAEETEEGIELMESGCCGGGGNAVLRAKANLGMIPQALIEELEGLQSVPTPSNGSSQRKTSGSLDYTMMEFTGVQTGGITYSPPGKGRSYTGANNDLERRVQVHPDDVIWMKSTGMFKVI